MKKYLIEITFYKSCTSKHSFTYSSITAYDAVLVTMTGLNLTWGKLVFSVLPDCFVLMEIAAEIIKLCNQKSKFTYICY